MEKVLKALVVKKTKKESSHSHNLLLLMKQAMLDLSQEEKDLLDLVNDFNIRVRYPDYKLAFYKKCTRDFTILYLAKIKKLYKKLCQKVESKN